MKNLLISISQVLIDVIIPKNTSIKGHYLSRIIFLGMCLSLLIAYPIYASNGTILTKSHAYAIGILICLTFALSIYLFWVIFQPERF